MSKKHLYYFLNDIQDYFILINSLETFV